MTKTDLNKVQEGKGKEKIEENTGEQGTTSKTELGANLSETQLTTEGKIEKLGQNITNVNAGVSELLNLSKHVVKKQEDMENMIENQIPKSAENAITTAEIHQEVGIVKQDVEVIKKEMGSITQQIGEVKQQIDHITQQISTMMPSKDKIFHDIFSGKDGGEIQVISNAWVQKGGIYANIVPGSVKNDFTCHPENCDNIGSRYTKNLQDIMLYCIRIILALKSRGMSIENSEGLDIKGNEIFCKTQGFSWTIEEIKKGIKVYCPREYNKIEDILTYILYLYNKHK